MILERPLRERREEPEDEVVFKVGMTGSCNGSVDRTAKRGLGHK